MASAPGWTDNLGRAFAASPVPFWPGKAHYRGPFNNVKAWSWHAFGGVFAVSQRLNQA